MMRLSRRTALAVSLALAALSAQSVLGVTHVWNGGNGFGPDSMNLALNWSGGTPVSSSSNLTLIFPNGASNFTPNQNIPSPPLVLQSLQQTGGFYTFSGGAFRFANLGAAPSITTLAANFNNGMEFQDDTTWAANVSNVTVIGAFSGGGDATITGTGSNSFQISGAGSNTHSGTLTFNNFNQVILNRGGNVTQGAVVINNTNLYTNVANQFGNNSNVTVTNGGFWQANTSQVFRDLTLEGGSGVGTGGAVTLSMNGNLYSSSGGNSLGNNASAMLDLGGVQRNFNITSTGTNELVSINASIINGSFIKTGLGGVGIYGGSNSFNAQNIISAGRVYSTVGAIGSVNIGASGTLRLFGGDFNAPVLFGSGTVEYNSYHVFNIAQSFTGVNDVNGGGGLIGTGATLPGNITSTNSGNVYFQETGSGTYNGTLSGGVFASKQFTGTLSIGGTNTHTAGFELQQGTLRLLSDSALGTGTFFPGSTGPQSNLEAVGTRVVANPIAPLGNLSIIGSGNLHFTDTAQKFSNWSLIHNSASTTTIDGKFAVGGSGVVTVNSGTLVLGNPAVVGGFTSGGQIIVNGGVLTVRSFNFTTLPDVTLAGGVLNAPNGYAIPLGAALQGNGGVTGRVASANGSSILANGNLGIGDGAHVAGVNLDGELYTNQFTVSLFDSNQSVLGSLTQIGTGSNNGTLNAANGIVLNFGRNITGRGTIVSTNLLATASIINGDVQGDSFADYIEFTGYVKGVGNFNNVAFSGTFAPGLSPTLLTVGNVILTPSNVLDIELGGLNRGSQYDAFDITGLMKINGTLQLSYINAFTASLGDQFNIFDGPTTGTFSGFNFPPLPNGWLWDTSLLYSQGIVQVVVPEPASLAGLSLAGLSLLRRRR